MKNYTSSRCDLCGSSKSEIILKSASPFGVTSDSRIVRWSLRKVICKNCGLVREGNDLSIERLEGHYRDDYSLNVHEYEHVFFRNGVPVARSAAIAEWISQVLEESGLKSRVHSVYEVGAGQGQLIAQLAKMLPGATFSGCEINPLAADIARRKLIDVACGELPAIGTRYDLIIAIGVLEHVPSPRAFLRSLVPYLNRDGSILIGQPMQDVRSYDVFFVDHLHHFHTMHIESLAASCGLIQTFVAKSPWFADSFSIQLLQPGATERRPIEFVPPDSTKEAIEYWEKTFDMIGHLEKEKGYAIYGMGEIATLLYCYGGLSNLRIVVGLDDLSERYKTNHLGIKVKKVEELTKEEKASIFSVILCMNPIYYDFVSRKCKQHDLEVIRLFDTGSYCR